MMPEPKTLVPPYAALRIIADDLTGALDSAAPFSSPMHPVHVSFSWRGPLSGARLSISTDSRDLAVDISTQRVAQMTRNQLSAAPMGALWFKKVDSVLRGHPVEETLAVFRAAAFSHLVFAPAYPGLGRVTVKGRQHVVEPHGGQLRPVGPDLAVAFAMAGLTIATKPTTSVDTGSVIILDANSQDELSLQVEQWRSVLPDTALWAGAGGLALALGGGRSAVVFPDLAQVLVGTRHPVTQAQVEHLAGRRGGQMPQAPEIFYPAFHSASPEETAVALAERCHAMDPVQLAGRSVLVVGGDTLATVMRAVEAEHLVCLGEAAPGVAVSRIAGGRWSGISLLSKSGGFGARDLLHRLAGLPPGGP